MADRALQPPPTDAEPGEFLIVRAGDELYALPGPAVREIARWRTPTPVPGAPPVIVGIISQRGQIMPVVDLRVALGLSAAPPERATRLVLVQHDAADMALLVDAVVDLAPVPAAALAQPPAGLDAARIRLLSAVARYNDYPLAVLSLVALVATVGEG